MPRRRSRGDGRGYEASRRLSVEDTPFRDLLEIDEELARARQEYAGQSREERRLAADWSYHSGEADRIFQSALGAQVEDPWRPALLALAIDPTYAPAILTVGTLEYELERRDEALELLSSLVTLPADTEDLAVIIDKAGSYLLDRQDFEAALALYEAAASAYPTVALHHSSVGYCLGKLGRLQAAVASTRRAVELEPENSEHLNDLGYTLFEAGQYDEAERVLEKAVLLAVPGYERPRNNLAEVRRTRAARREGEPV